MTRNDQLLTVVRSLQTACNELVKMVTDSDVKEDRPNLDYTSLENNLDSMRKGKEVVKDNKTWIKNLTDSVILLDFNGDRCYSKSARQDYMKATNRIVSFVEKSEFSKEKLESKQIKNLYDKHLIEDVTEEEAKIGLAKIKADEKKERERIASRRKAKSDIVKLPLEDDVRSLGSGGVKMGDSEHLNVGEILSDPDNLKEENFSENFFPGQTVGDALLQLKEKLSEEKGVLS